MHLNHSVGVTIYILKTRNKTEMILFIDPLDDTCQSNMAVIILEKQHRISILQSVYFTQSSSSLQMSSHPHLNHCQCLHLHWQPQQCPNHHKHRT
jgi:hypothetical protein